MSPCIKAAFSRANPPFISIIKDGNGPAAGVSLREITFSSLAFVSYR